MLKEPIYIQSSSIVSPLSGNNYYDKNTAIKQGAFGLQAGLPDVQNDVVKLLRQEKSLSTVDRSVLLGISAARNLEISGSKIGVNIGSSRGATGIWEAAYDRFRESGIPPTQSSPLTTLGNISTWVAQDLGIDALPFSHSITCATAAHSILNAVAWLESGMLDTFIAGGVEAPLTAFTIAQMKALRIYATDDNDAYPCRAIQPSKSHNSMVLGEGAGLFVLQKNKTMHSLSAIVGYGAAIEPLTSATSLSENGQCLQDAMRAATKNTSLDEVDAIITHAPGTIKGDRAEMQAIKAVFGNNHPALCNNKWQVGHTLGASSALSLQMAIDMFNEERLFTIPYLEDSFTNPRGIKTPKRILINATGFGGNAVSLLIERA